MLNYNHMKYETYQRLSWKTFFITLLQNSLTPIMFSFIWIVLVILKTVDIKLLLPLPDSTEIIETFTKLLDFTIVFGLGVILLFWLIVIIRTLINYLTFYFMLGPNSIGIKKGLIHIDENMIPYRHIENIEINQPLIYRIFGMCRLHILTGGEDKDIEHSHTMEINFPILEKIIADDIKTEIFERTHIKVVNSV
jgi:membrane protein YdbS with pleckstrin-like domain